MTDVEVRRGGGLRWLAWPGLDRVGVDAIVTERSGGVSEGPYASLNLGLHVGDDDAAVVENRRRAVSAIGGDLDDLVLGTQVHGRAVVEVGPADRGRGARSVADTVGPADALVTTEPGVILAVLVADCVPVVLVDPVARVLACVHAGWRGTVADVVGAAIAVMVDRGATPSDLVTLLGPAIEPARYQVGADVADAATECFGSDVGRVLVPDDEGRWRFDLWTANVLLLERAGVPASQVSTAGALPTGDGRFFSDRAERPCGRFAALARLR